MNEFIPTKMINNSKRKLPWINKEIKSQKKKQTVQENEPTQKHKNNTTI